MKKLITYSIMTVALVWSVQSFGQTTFTLESGELTPEEEGFFLAGVTYDFNNDGLDEFVNGCPGEFDFEDYERRDPGNVTYDLHIESGEQFGFSYHNSMILPVCDAKYPSELDPAISHGFIQLRPRIDTSDVELRNSYILSPEMSNLQSITIETSADVSIQPDRRLIPYNIEYSLDGGETFEEDFYISDVVQLQGGYRAEYTAENNADFKQMQTDSKSKNVILRFITNYDNPELGAYKGQYVKIHKIIIEADAPMEEPVVVLNSELTREKNPIRVKDGAISSTGASVRVYSISGRFIGAGESVTVHKGLYVVVTSDYQKRKVFVQ